jgi:hypothetical protein
MHQTCLKCEKTYFKKTNIHTQLTTWEKNANIKNLPHPSHHFSNGPSLSRGAWFRALVKLTQEVTYSDSAFHAI